MLRYLYSASEQSQYTCYLYTANTRTPWKLTTTPSCSHGQLISLCSRSSWSCRDHIRCQLLHLSIDSKDYELSCPHALQRQSNSPDRRWPFVFGWLSKEFVLWLNDIFLSSGIIQLVHQITPIGLFPRTPFFANQSIQDSPDPVTGHSSLLHTLHLFGLPRGLTCMQPVLLPSTNSPHCRSSSECSLMHHHPLRLLPLASGARRSPLIYVANGIRSDSTAATYTVL